jgi:hypothetical protein
MRPYRQGSNPYGYWISLIQLKWPPEGGFMGTDMRSLQTTAFMGTTATAVAFAYTAIVVDHAVSMWSTPVVKHVNKRRSRQPRGILN